MSIASGMTAAPRFIALALNMARAILPNLQVLDTLFPTAPFLLTGAPAELAFFPSNIPDEATEFYARFRQGGGTRPILPFAAALPEALEAAVAAGQPLLVALHITNVVDAIAPLREAVFLPTLLLLTQEDSDEALQPLRNIGYSGCCFFRLIQGETDDGFCLLSAETETSTLLQLLETASKTSAIDMRFASRAGAAPDTLIVFLPPGYDTWTKTSLNPFVLVHDGTKTPEGDEEYAWLWFSDEPHARILLGPTAHRFRRVRVVVPNALTTHNLQEMRLLINGTVVASHVDLWSEKSGAISADLPEDLPPPLVLGLWVPEGEVPDGGTSKLFVCIDHIELSA
jgi:hypothetical protein